MKKFKKAKIVVMLAAVVLTLTLWGIRTYAGCLDVRDYGHHTYSARVYVQRETTVLSYTVEVSYGVYYFYTVWQDRLLECVCGKQIMLYQCRAGDFYELIPY